MLYLTDTDLSHLILYARLKEFGYEPSYQPNLCSELGKRLMIDLKNGYASRGQEAEIDRIYYLAKGSA